MKSIKIVCVRLIACFAAIVLTAAHGRAVQFEFQYADAAGTGFLDPATGASRIAALEYAASKSWRVIRDLMPRRAEA